MYELLPRAIDARSAILEVIHWGQTALQRLPIGRPVVRLEDRPSACPSHSNPVFLPSLSKSQMTLTWLGAVCPPPDRAPTDVPRPLSGEPPPTEKRHRSHRGRLKTALASSARYQRLVSAFWWHLRPHDCRRFLNALRTNDRDRLSYKRFSDCCGVRLQADRRQGPAKAGHYVVRHSEKRHNAAAAASIEPLRGRTEMAPRPKCCHAGHR
jgi:hypothetical protein